MRKINNEDGFTLVEMLIVLAIISILILIAIPNVTKQSKVIDEKGCEAYVLMVQGQVEAYKLEKKSYPTNLGDLVTEGFLKEDPVCPNGSALTLNAGKVNESSN
ncbi:prepilin-type N-terminal cleavage/methylation domain-containing protein [Sporosarcina sp. Marseille-Q4063]|uniref:competence type IV pilus major pilin ComGC n=1 Tax=Sporosarcina sp. Marseille-Q4063 TaxID=2810514 RepID=UPI001BB046B3|nr:competence type IV pilus major pilin ComGC [Sporosarcina sp. Marseille-Q4063]QUW22258.1 prepilin-type N-terminal cleavage/methylation domain-containing protein [Sporosarcina sp. Marseille-Q4063]